MSIFYIMRGILKDALLAMRMQFYKSPSVKSKTAIAEEYNRMHKRINYAARRRHRHQSR